MSAEDEIGLDSPDMYAEALCALEPPEERECQYLGCSRQNVGRVRFEGDSTTRLLCRYHAKHFHRKSS